jgi:hypothetical protein
MDFEASQKNQRVYVFRTWRFENIRLFCKIAMNNLLNLNHILDNSFHVLMPKSTVEITRHVEMDHPLLLIGSMIQLQKLHWKLMFLKS